MRAIVLALTLSASGLASQALAQECNPSDVSQTWCYICTARRRPGPAARWATSPASGRAPDYCAGGTGQLMSPSWQFR